MCTFSGQQGSAHAKLAFFAVQDPARARADRTTVKCSLTVEQVRIAAVKQFIHSHVVTFYKV